MDEYIGMIKAFAGTFVPRGYLGCNGQLLPIQQYSTLFALLGTNYGGDGQTTFGLPDLRGRSLIGTGQGSGLPTNHVLGEKLGAESTSITINNMPAHTHAAATTFTLNVSNQEADVAVPVAGNSLAAMIDTGANQIIGYTTKTPTIALGGATIATTNAVIGGSLPISILQPTLAITYIICIEGGFPSRN
ncbi:phage tail protein [Pedobacter gandavensis]|uniref:Phage tail protein n=1 Tax=Pedobacter gandavensis TaxID=2679963 RepID=A0ABR6EXA9_9SPHI|nr:tail fiber protein [Pedobacter gandavensis]MBB2149927.1 phage tail protein [Pedobacter gandavensis]